MCETCGCGDPELVSVELHEKMRKSLGAKRKDLSDANIEAIVKLYGDGAETEQSRIFDNTDFGYRTIVVERPLRDAEGKVVLGEKGKQKGRPQPDASLRDTENVPCGCEDRALCTIPPLSSSMDRRDPGSLGRAAQRRALRGAERGRWRGSSRPHGLTSSWRDRGR